MTTGRDWYSYGSIRYTKSQVLWLLSYLDLLRAGFWPSDYKETGYSGGKGKPQRHSAPFEKAIQVSAELTRRIERAWPDSALLLLSVAYGDIEQVMANGENSDVARIRRRINSALAYICGKSPRWVDCLGVGECSECQGCPRFRDKDGNVKCKKRPRQGRTYHEFKSHKKGRSQDNP